MADEPKMTINEIRRSGHCSIGIRRWFEDKGYDFKQVLKEGVTLQEIADMNDGFGNQVVERVRAKRNEAV